MKKVIYSILLCLTSILAYGQPANDMCSGALPIPVDCDANGSVSGTTAMATGESFSTSCILGTDLAVWYEFTAVGTDFSIRNTGGGPNPNFAILSATDCSGSFAEVVCGTMMPSFDGDNILTIGETYFLLVAFPSGAEGTFNLCLSNYEQVPNEVPCDAIEIPSTLTYSGSTWGSGPDLFANCDPTNSFVNSQFFKYTVPDNTFKIDLNLNSSTLTGPLGLHVYTEDPDNPDCDMLFVVEEECAGALPTSLEDICVFPGQTYYISVASQLNDNGEFTLEVVRLIPTACNENEICDVAKPLSEGGFIASDCEEKTFNECNTDACPDQFTLGPCDATSGPTVWYEFTTDSEASLIDIILDNATAPTNFVFIDACDFSGENFCVRYNAGDAQAAYELQEILPNTTYYIGVTTPGLTGGSYDLNIKIYPSIERDYFCTPQDLNIGSNLTDNICSTNDGVSVDGSTPVTVPSNCSTPTSPQEEATVWYSYTISSDEVDAVIVTITPSGSNPINAQALVQFGVAASYHTCNAEELTHLIDDEFCGILNEPLEYIFECIEETELWIRVGSAADDAGSYDIHIEEVSTVCNDNDECDDAPPAMFVLNPMTNPDLSQIDYACGTYCMTHACPEDEPLNGCDFTVNPTVWIQVQTDADAAQMLSSITTNGTWTPIWSVFYGNCDELTNAGANIICSSDLTSGVYQTAVESGTNTYYIAVTADPNGLPIDDPEFEICVATIVNVLVCLGNEDEGCGESDPSFNIEVAQREFGGDLEGPFCPGELITVNLSFFYDASESGQDWLLGFVPMFGAGWDIEDFDFDAFAPVANGQMGEWHETGTDCEPRITEPVGHLCTYTDSKGDLRICNSLCELCPCSGGMVPNDPLPSGYFWIQDGGSSTCVAGSCLPSEQFGIGSVTANITWSVDLRVRSFDDASECNDNNDLQISLLTFSDGGAGCWDDPQGECLIDYTQFGPKWLVDCQIATIDSIPPIEICDGENAEFNINVMPDNAFVQLTSVAGPNITGNTMGPVSVDFISDQLFNSNPNGDPEQVIYKIIAKPSQESRCQSDTVEVEVTVYTPIMVEIPDPIPYFCAGEDVVFDFTEYISGGDGNYTVTWNNTEGESGTGTVYMGIPQPDRTVTFTLDIIDDHGCEGNGMIPIIIGPEIEVAISGIDSICESDGMTTLTAAPSGGTGVYVSYDWGTPSGGVINTGLINMFTQADETGTYSVTVTDDKGCQAEDEFEFTVYENPMPDIVMDPFNGQICSADGGVDIDVEVTYQNQVYNGDWTYGWIVPGTFTMDVQNMSMFTVDKSGPYIVTVEDDFGCSGGDTVIVQVYDSPDAAPQTLIACLSADGNADFDLSSITDAINNNGLAGAGFIVNFFEDSLANFPITGPDIMAYGSTGGIVWANVFNPASGVVGCYSSTVPITLELEEAIEGDTLALTLCNQGQDRHEVNLRDYDDQILRNPAGVISWYEDRDLIISIDDPATMMYSVTTQQLFVTIEEDGCFSLPIPVNFTVETTENANPASQTVCQEADGTGTFNLQDLENTITGGTGATVTFFSDAALTMEITDRLEYNALPGVIYAYYEDAEGCVSNPSEVTLQVEIQLDAMEAALEICKESDGQGTFDLTAAIPTITDGDNTLTVTFYTNNDRTGEITDNTMYRSFDGQVYATMTDGKCISDVATITLTVTDGLEANIPPVLDVCDPGDGTGTFNLTNRDNDVNGNNGWTVSWYLDTMTAAVADPTNVVTMPRTVWARATEGNCVSQFVPLELTVTPGAAPNPATLDTCDRGQGNALFDLTLANPQINADQSLTFQYYRDAVATDEITGALINSYPAMDGDIVYTTWYDPVGRCGSDGTGELVLNVSITVFGEQPDPFTECIQFENEEGVFDLTTLEFGIYGENGATFSWYEEASTSTLISDPSNYRSGNGSVWVIITDINGCVSQPMEVDLNVEYQLTAQDASISTCDEGGGEGTFDLTAYEGGIAGSVDNSVMWYEDMAGTIPLSNPNAYVGMNGDVVYARIMSNKGCISPIKAYTLEIVNDLPAAPAKVDACNDGLGNGAFNLENAISTIQAGNPGFTVEFYVDMALTMPITPPNTTAYTTAAPAVVYAITVDGNCRSLPVEVSLELIEDLIANPTSDNLCDEGNGTATFDLTSYETAVGKFGVLNVIWYSDMAGTNVIDASQPFVSGSTTVYARVTDGNCESNIAAITLDVTTIDTKNDGPFDTCDEGAGIGYYNLNNLNDGIRLNPSHTVTYYLDEDLTMPITNTTNFETSSGTIYAVVSDGRCNSNPVAIELNVTNDLMGQTAQMSLCDEGNNKATFDIKTLESTINGNNGLDIEWFMDDQENTPITNTMMTTGTIRIWAVMVNGNCRAPIVPVDLIVNPNPVADAGQDMVLTCVTPEIDLQGTGSSQGSEYTYTWTTDDGNILSGETSQTPRIDAPGTYKLVVLNTTTNCSSEDEVVVTPDANLPTADAGNNQTLTCNSPSTSIGTTATSNGTDIEITWTLDGDIVGNSAVITVTKPGTYELEVLETSTGCKSKDLVDVINNVDTLVDAVLDTIDPNCNGESTGCIRLVSVGGGEEPYQIALDGLNFGNELCGLAAGDYVVTIRDVNECLLEVNATLTEPEVLAVELTAPLFVDYKDSALVAAIVSPTDREISTYDWATDAWFENVTDSLIRAYSLDEFPVSVQITDVNGCIATDQIIVYVRKDFKVYAPTAISPFTTPGTNDNFMVYGDPDIVTSVDVLRIYDRWGEKVFERENIDINDESQGWNGIWQDQEMSHGAYAFYVKVTFVDGTTDIISGEFTLIR